MIEIFPGEIWSIKSKNKEISYKALVLKLDAMEHENIVHIAILGNDGEVCITQMPFDRSAFLRSVGTVVGRLTQLPEFMEGYRYWRSEFERGSAGIYDLEIGEALDL